GQNATWVVGPSAPYVGTLYPNVLVLPPVSAASNSVVNVAFSATPVFTCPAGAAIVIFKMSPLTGNVTSSTLAGMTAGQIIIFDITEDATGGHTFLFPTNVIRAQAIDTT